MTKKFHSEARAKKVQPFRTLSLGYQGKGAHKFISDLPKIFETVLGQGGPGKAMGSSPTVYNFHPLEILYHRLQVNLQPVSYEYLTGSGIYRYTGNPNHTVDIQDFLHAYYPDGDLSSAANLTFAQNLYNMSGTGGAPNMIVKKQCYVVVELNGGPGLSCLAGAAAIDTDDDKCGDDYCGLNHVDASGTPHPGTAPREADNNPCQLLYFGVENPDLANRERDQFNLYLQVESPTNVTFVTVDPFIKNRGGKPPLFKSPKK